MASNKKQLEWIVNIVISSGIGTMQQRIALAQRITDAYAERTRQAKEKQNG